MVLTSFSATRTTGTTKLRNLMLAYGGTGNKRYTALEIISSTECKSGSRIRKVMVMILHSMVSNLAAETLLANKVRFKFSKDFGEAGKTGSR